MRSSDHYPSLRFDTVPAEPIDLSFIVPAYNEASNIAETVTNIRRAAQASGYRYELIVVDDASDDGTGPIARAAGAQVVSVQLRHIAAVRNAGARAARGDVLVFVDADTVVPPGTLHQALGALRQQAIGGGAGLEVDDDTTWLGECVVWLWNWYARMAGRACGCFLFVRREHFFGVGGFDESYYAAEDLALSKALQRRGRFVILKEKVATSSRKERLFSWWDMVSLYSKVVLTRGRIYKERAPLEYWYDGRREESHS